MSGLQEITAILAVVELGIKSLSAVYNLIQTLRHIPIRIQQAKHELRDILHCLAGLRSIQTADSGTIHAINRAGLEASMSSCREACDELQGLLSTWNPQQSSIAAKLKYFRHRKAFDGLLEDITNRKQNTTLALGITQLSLQVSSQQATISHSRSLELFMANYQARHTMAEQNNPDTTSPPQHADGATSGLEVACTQPVNNRTTDDQSSPSTTSSPQSAYGMPMGIQNQALQWIESRTAFAEHNDTSAESSTRREHGAQVFGSASQVFAMGAYIDGGTKNKIGMPQAVAGDLIKSNQPRFLQWFGGEARIGKKSNGNMIGIFKD